MIFWMYNAYSAQYEYRDFVGTESRWYIPSKYTVLSRLFDSQYLEKNTWDVTSSIFFQ